MNALLNLIISFISILRLLRSWFANCFGIDFHNTHLNVWNVSLPDATHVNMLAFNLNGWSNHSIKCFAQTSLKTRWIRCTFVLESFFPSVSTRKYAFGIKIYFLFVPLHLLHWKHRITFFRSYTSLQDGHVATILLNKERQLFCFYH